MGVRKVTFNCAPALSNDGAVVYVAINTGTGASNSNFGSGYLVGLNSTTLATKYSVKLFDYQSPGNLAVLPDDGTASPCVGPDGDVYFGVLENPFYSNHLRGWMLHYDSQLLTPKIAGGFGWDDTASIVPASAVPSYTGASSYLVLTKYNNYVEGNGDGYNRVAIQDPNAAETVTVAGTSPVTNTNIMKEVISLPGPTIDTRYNNPSANPNPYPNAVREWCVNSVVVDGPNKCAAVNSEDGSLYRWDFTTNSVTAKLVFNNGIGEAYTPTFVGPDGQVYAINNAVLFACEAAQRPR